MNHNYILYTLLPAGVGVGETVIGEAVTDSVRICEGVTGVVETGREATGVV